jgi:hypothetical protein
MGQAWLKGLGAPSARPRMQVMPLTVVRWPCPASSVGMVTSQLISAGEPFEGHAKAGLVVDRVCTGAALSRTGPPSAGAAAAGRAARRHQASGGQQPPGLVALSTSGASADWPDVIDDLRVHYRGRANLPR